MVTVTKNNGNTTFTFTVTQTSENLDPRLALLAEYDWTHGYGETEEVDGEQVAIAFEDATNQQKMGAINRRTKALYLEEVRTMEAIKRKKASDENDKTEYEELEEL